MSLDVNRWVALVLATIPTFVCIKVFVWFDPQRKKKRPDKTFALFLFRWMFLVDFTDGINFSCIFHKFLYSVRSYELHVEKKKTKNFKYIELVDV